MIFVRVGNVQSEDSAESCVLAVEGRRLRAAIVVAPSSVVLTVLRSEHLSAPRDCFAMVFAIVLEAEVETEKGVQVEGLPVEVRRLRGGRTDAVLPAYHRHSWSD